MNKEKYEQILEELNSKTQLIAVSKTRPNEQIEALYDLGQRAFGENRPRELQKKAEALPKDIQWHMIGHLQRKSVKYIAPHVSMIHSVDSIALAKEINKRAAQNDRTISILLQVHIADEEAKFGFEPADFIEICQELQAMELPNVSIRGVMGMATFTNKQEQIKQEFTLLNTLFNQAKQIFGNQFTELSMGMSGDYKIAIECGSTMVRIGSLLFDS